MDAILSFVSVLADEIEGHFLDVPRWKIVIGSFAVASLLLRIRRFHQETEDIVKYAKETSYKWARKLPPIKKKIEAELDTARISVQEEIVSPKERQMRKFNKVPQKGLSAAETLELTHQTVSLGNYDWKQGKVSGGMFAGRDDEYNNFLIRLHRMTAYTNQLHADIFPGIVKMEAEVVRMTINLFHGDENVTGTTTSGGTESLLLMMKSYRDWARKTKGIKRPEAIVPNSIHATIAKGQQILDYTKIRRLPLDPKTMTVRPSDIRRNINSNTVMIVISAPDYSYGAIDDVEAIAAIAKSKGIPLHVDCCLGGFILPFMEKAGFPLPRFDFRVPGVTSISADNHKYGRTPKGTSVIMYRSKELLHHQYFVITDWPGGVYASPTIAGSRVGCNVAMCWGAMLSHGIDGYVEITRKIITVARYLKREFSQIPGIFVYGDPKVSVVAIGSKEFDIYQVADVMLSKGWHLQPIQHPSGVHVFLTELHTHDGVAEELVKQLKIAVKTIQSGSADSRKGLAKLYGMSHSIPTTILKEATYVYNDVYYSTPE